MNGIQSTCFNTKEADHNELHCFNSILLIPFRNVVYTESSSKRTHVICYASPISLLNNFITD